MTGILLTMGILFSMPDSLPDMLSVTFSHTPKVFHHPARVLFNSRAFYLEVFVKFPRTDLESVSLFYKTDAMPRFVEIPMDINATRYRFRYDPIQRPAQKITYFFTVATTGGSLYATPVDSSGILKPLTKYLLDPRSYFKRRAALKY